MAIYLANRTEKYYICKRTSNIRSMVLRIEKITYDEVLQFQKIYEDFYEDYHERTGRNFPKNTQVVRKVTVIDDNTNSFPAVKIKEELEQSIGCKVVRLDEIEKGAIFYCSFVKDGFTIKLRKGDIHNLRANVERLLNQRKSVLGRIFG